MSTLAQINGESLAVPGLRFWGARDVQQSGWADRFSLIASDHRGAIELWEVRDERLAGFSTLRGAYGGIEVHSPTPKYDGHEPMAECVVLGGRDCYCDGSSLAYAEKARPLIEAGDSAALLRLLADWHASHFGGAS